MAPPRSHHHHANNHQYSGAGGSPFPPLGLAAAATAANPSSSLLSSSAFSSSNGSSNEAAAAIGDSSSGLPPAPHKVDASQAQACRLQDAYWSDEEEDMDCPLCLEEIDLSDANFKPCPCGYQICRFCWHHIKQNLNGRCPACRRKYSDTSVEFKAMSQDEIKRLSQAKKQKEREKKELEQMNRKHLANMRVVQKNLVYVVGLDPKLAKEELIPTLRSNEFFGQYGRISKILISKRTTASKLVMGTQESAIGVYVTYVRKEDAARAIIAIDGSKGPDGKTIRASYGTTKYCTTYLRNLPCTNAICTYLHEPGEEADSFTKEDLSTLRHAAKDTEHKSRPTPTPASFSTATATPKQEIQMANLAIAEAIESSALPKTASWASGKPMGAGNAASGSSFSTTQGQTNGITGGQSSNAIRDQDLPPLSALQHSNVTRKGSGHRPPLSPASAKIPTAPKGRGTNAVGPLSNGSASPFTRSESPKPANVDATAANSIASPLSSPAQSNSTALPPPPPPPPGLSKQPPKGPSAMQSPLQRSLSKDGGDGSYPSSPSAPPGLTKPATDSPATPSRANTESEASSAMAAASTYQPSSEAQALLDDMRSRREAEAHLPTKSPFPDFDATLSSFKDGDDFCFTFEEGQIPANMKDPSNGRGEGVALSAFTPFGATHHPASSYKYFGRASPTPPPPPPGIATPTRSTSASPSPLPGLFGLNGSDGSAGYTGRFDPFASNVGDIAALDVKAKPNPPFTAIDQMSRTLSGERAENGARGEEKDDEEARPSRFGFSNKRRESPFFKTHDDLLGFVKGGAARMTEGDSGQGQQQQQQQQQQPPQHVGPTIDSSSWLSDLQKRATAAQMQSNQSTVGNGYALERGAGGNGYGAGNNREDPLLAQLMNYRPLDGLPYHDPAIMSYTRQQQQQQQAQAQAQAHAHQHHQQQQQQHLHHQHSGPVHSGPVSPQDSYGGGFNPFESQQQQQQQQHSSAAYRSGSNFQQPYGSHRTFT